MSWSNINKAGQNPPQSPYGELTLSPFGYASKLADRSVGGFCPAEHVASHEASGHSLPKSWGSEWPQTKPAHKLGLVWFVKTIKPMKGAFVKVARKSKYVKVIMSHEISAMKMLWRTGVCTDKQLKGHFNISTDRLKKLVNSQYLKMSQGKVILAEKGKKQMKSIGMKYQYKTSFRNVAHDMKLTQRYLETPEQFRSTWKTEAQLRNEAKQSPKYEEFKKRMQELHPQNKVHATPDAAVYDPTVGGLVAIEITTLNYKEVDIQQKVEFANEFLSGYRQY